MHTFRNVLIWIVGLIVILVIEGKLPRSEMEWRIIGLGAFLFWLGAGALLTVRWLYQFVTRV